MSALDLRTSAPLGSSEAREEVIQPGLYERIAAAMDANVEPAADYPPHYVLSDGTQSLDFIEATLGPEQFEGFLRGNVLKYTIRYDRKGQAESDLRKAEDYASRLRAHLAKHG